MRRCGTRPQHIKQATSTLITTWRTDQFERGDLSGAKSCSVLTHIDCWYTVRMQSKAATVDQYIAELPADRREVVSAIRRVFLTNLDKGFEERMSYGMIGYCVPHSIYPAGYHCDPRQPLPFAGVAAQKNAYSVYLFCIYADADEGMRFRKAWSATGKKLDMGKSCIRFNKLEDCALDVIAETLKRVTVESHIKQYEKSVPGAAGRSAAAIESKPARSKTSTSRPAKKPTAKKPTAKKPAAKKPPAKKNAAGKKAARR